MFRGLRLSLVICSELPVNEARLNENVLTNALFPSDGVGFCCLEIGAVKVVEVLQIEKCFD